MTSSVSNVFDCEIDRHIPLCLVSDHGLEITTRLDLQQIIYMIDYFTCRGRAPDYLCGYTPGKLISVYRCKSRIKCFEIIEWKALFLHKLLQSVVTCFDVGFKVNLSTLLVWSRRKGIIFQVTRWVFSSKQHNIEQGDCMHKTFRGPTEGPR